MAHTKIKSTHDYLVEHSLHYSGDPSKYGTYMPAQYDKYFKTLVAAEWCIKSNGDVESTTGYYALIEVAESDKHDLELRSVLEDALLFGDLPPVGWYVTVEDSDGFIFAYKFTNKYGAETAFEELEQRYENWLTAGDEEI